MKEFIAQIVVGSIMTTLILSNGGGGALLINWAYNLNRWDPYIAIPLGCISFSFFAGILFTIDQWLESKP